MVFSLFAFWIFDIIVSPFLCFSFFSWYLQKKPVDDDVESFDDRKTSLVLFFVFDPLNYLFRYDLLLPTFPCGAQSHYHDLLPAQQWQAHT